MDKKRRPLDLEKDDAEFAFDLTPDLTGGRASRQHKRTPSGADGEGVHRNRTENGTHPGRRDEAF